MIPNRFYMFGFAHPTTGRNRAVILPKANTATMTEALAEFARWAAPDGRKVLVRIVDNAAWHIAGKLAVPANVVLHPCRRVPRSCSRSNAVAAGTGSAGEQGVPTLPALEVPPRDRLGWLAENTATVKGAVGFHWAVALE